MKRVKIIECPRDAMQGIPEYIPAQAKADYINALLKVGFDTIDFGSFVSPKAIPQLRDTAEVLEKLDTGSTESKLLAITGNVRGANNACRHREIKYLGFPHSVSPTFLEKNINSNLEKSRNSIKEILEICVAHDKELVAYVSMGFGNPYGDEWSVDAVMEEVAVLIKMGVRIIPLSDTIGKSTPENIARMFAAATKNFPGIEFGFHLHTNIWRWREQVDAAYANGCRRFDTVLLGLGGCPMAEDELVGNLKTVSLLEYLEEKGIRQGINKEAFEKAFIKSLITFKKFIN